MKTISVDELQDLINEAADFQLIDVREPHEYEAANLGGELIPLQTVPQNVEKIAKDKQVVIMCRSGNRSGQAVMFLEQNFGLENLYNLEGGILDWKAEIDSTLDVD